MSQAVRFAVAGLLAVFVLLGSVMVVRGEDQAVDLQPHWQAGRTSRFDFWNLRRTTTATRVNAQAGEPFTRSLETSGRITWTVEKVKPDGSAVCLMTIDWISATLTDPQGDSEYNDSRKASGDNARVHGLVRAIAGAPLRCEVNADGTVQKIIGMEAIQRRVPDGVPAPDELEFLETANDLATLPGVPAALPGAPGLASGRGWERRYDASHELGKLQRSMRYRLGGVEEIAGIPVATVEGEAQSRLEVDAAKVPRAANARIRLTANRLTTQVMFDLQRHETVGRNSLETRGMEISVRAEDATITTQVDETIQDQLLRAAEE